MKTPPEPGLLDQAPIWLHAVLGALGAVFVSGAIVVTPLFAAWLTSAASTVPAMQAVRIGIDVWLLAHGGSLHVGNGAFSLVPWLLTLLPLCCLVWSAGRLAMRFPVEHRVPRSVGGLRRDVLVGGLCFVGTYAVAAVLLALMTRLDAVSASVPRAFLGPLALAALAYVVAVRRAFADDPDDLAPGFTWGLREYVPRWVRRSVRPALVGTAALLIAGMIGALVLVGVNFSRITGLYDTVGAGWTGGTVLTLGQLAYLPTVGGWALSFAAGPGFALGEGSSISWGAVQPGYLPLVPALGALPDPGPLPAWVIAFVAVPVLVGFVVGVRCSRRAGGADLSWAHRARAIACGIVLTGLFSSIVLACCTGSLGAARLSHIGPHVVLAGLALTGELLVGGLLAWTVSGVRLRRRERA